MKKICRMLVFSAFALLLTSLWNKGFMLSPDLKTFLIATVVLAIIFYIIVPLSKVLLLPLNFLTLGLFSFLVYIAILHFSSSTFHLFQIKEWRFNGYEVPYLLNLVLSSLSISSIINLLEQLL